jgi:hypothetical protein
MDAARFGLQQHVDHLYSTEPRQLAFRAETREMFAAWQQRLRQQVSALLGIAGRTLPSTFPVEELQRVDREPYVEVLYALDIGEVQVPLYVLVPKAEPPFKPILVFHGHSPAPEYEIGRYPNEEETARALAMDNNYAQALARAGYLTCLVVQRGFGKRLSDQVFHRADEHFTSSCRHLSFEYMMKGRNLLGERVWDGMCALSYLQTRDDVIPGIMGCTGNSGGGTTTLWLSALDERVTVSVPGSYFCSFKHSILSVYHCECNYVPGILTYAEMGDLAALVAPRPFRAIAGEQDPIFPIDGVYQQFQTVQRAYDLLGVTDRCSLAVHPGEHAYNHAMSHEWFGQWL